MKYFCLMMVGLLGLASPPVSANEPVDYRYFHKSYVTCDRLIAHPVRWFAIAFGHAIPPGWRYLMLEKMALTQGLRRSQAIREMTGAELRVVRQIYDLHRDVYEALPLFNWYQGPREDLLSLLQWQLELAQKAGRGAFSFDEVLSLKATAAELEIWHRLEEDGWTGNLLPHTLASAVIPKRRFLRLAVNDQRWEAPLPLSAALLVIEADNMRKVLAVRSQLAQYICDELWKRKNLIPPRFAKPLLYAVIQQDALRRGLKLYRAIVHEDPRFATTLWNTYTSRSARRRSDYDILGETYRMKFGNVDKLDRNLWEVSFGGNLDRTIEAALAPKKRPRR